MGRIQRRRACVLGGEGKVLVKYCDYCKWNDTLSYWYVIDNPEFYSEEEGLKKCPSCGSGLFKVGAYEDIP